MTVFKLFSEDGEKERQTNEEDDRGQNVDGTERQKETLSETVKENNADTEFDNEIKVDNTNYDEEVRLEGENIEGTSKKVENENSVITYHEKSDNIKVQSGVAPRDKVQEKDNGEESLSGVNFTNILYEQLFLDQSVLYSFFLTTV